MDWTTETREERNMSDRAIPIHTGCSNREDLAIYVEGFMEGSVVVMSLIVERHLAGLDFAAANELITDVLAHHRSQFSLQDDPDNGSEPCPVCGRLMPP